MNDLSPHHIQRIDHAHERIGAAEKRIAQLELDRAVADERMRQIQHALDGIQAGISRLGWLFVTGLGGSVVAFIIKGGLSP